MSSWRECKLGDVLELKYGKDHKALNDGKIPVFGSGGIMRYADTALYNDESILIPRKGTLNNIFYINEPFWTVDTIFWSKINQKEAFGKFVFYQLKTIDLASFNVGSAVPSLTTKVLNEIDIFLPPLKEQKAIAEVLSSFDDKIDLLHRQNQTLESLAQTLFRQWFENSDFDGIVGDISYIQNGYAFKSKDFQDFGSNGVLKIKNISNSIINILNTDFIDESVANKTDLKFQVSSGDILFGMTGAEIGKMGIVPQTNKKLWLNQRVGMLKEKYNGSKYLAYLQLTSEFGYDYIVNTATGSAQPNISGSDIEQCPFVKLGKDEIETYSSQVRPLFEKIVFNLGQIQTIENIRDTLLPKLLSGEVRVER